jgi:DNA invertase Pin-like site-specific DNA recombinase
MDNNISLNRKSESGQRIHKVTEKIRELLIKNNVSSIAKSYRSLGKKYNLSGHTVKKVLIDSGVKRKKSKMCPKSDEKQKNETKNA